MHRGQPLSQREIETLELAAKGKSNVQIGIALGISESSVATHLYRVRWKLGYPSQQALLMAIGKKGLVQLVGNAHLYPPGRLDRLAAFEVTVRDDDNS